MKKTIFSLFLLILSGCNSDDVSESSNQIESFLKSRVYLNLPSNAPNRDEFYEYESGLLKSATGFTHLLGNYTYNNGKLISMNNSFEQYTYQYDQNGRLTRRLETGTNNYIELFYQNNKVITHRYYEFGGSQSRLEQRELLLDNQGRIIQMIDLAQDQSAIDIEYETYEYDNNGNISKRTSKYLNNPQEVVTNYTYESIKNPYYNSFKEYYKLTYYLDFFLGLIIYNDYGLTPNLIQSSSSTYETNNFNYPTKENKQSNGDTFEIIYEYE